MCDCGNFRLKGVPCEEACALIHRLGLMPGDFVWDKLKVAFGLMSTELGLRGANVPNIVKSEPRSVEPSNSATVTTTTCRETIKEKKNERVGTTRFFKVPFASKEKEL